MSDKVLRTPAIDMNPAETQEWMESLDFALQKHGPDRVRFLLDKLQERARWHDVEIPFSANTPYVNTIPVERQPPYPGDREIERRIKSFIRWNAMSMVVRANREEAGIGGHISTYASAATLFEVGFNHFFRGKGEDFSGDQVYFQGHASPGVYARAFLEGRLGVEHLENFRRELRPPGGLSSYPHPWLMPNFWEFPTVSMGLSPIMGIYQARFNRYLEDRGIKDTSGSHVWVFMGDGETDEPEALGAITLAAREKLDNLIFVINCNMQRLDGPVRGNGKIIQELEAAFRGAGWNVIKVIWGGDWDPLIDKDEDGLLAQRMGEVVDGQYQKYVVEPGDYTRKDFFGAHPRLLQMVEHLSDEEIRKLRRGGHDPEKVYAAYKAAVEHEGAPTVILAKTIKGYGLGEHGEGRNVTHQQKKLNEDELWEFRARFGIPISDDELAQTPFYRPPEESREIKYMLERRRELGGFAPSREQRARPLKAPALEGFEEVLKGTGDRDLATTAAFVRMLSKLLRDPDIGRLIVPIIPDEARTFGMEPLFRQCGIYSHVGQLYEPVDKDTLLYYREVKDGQILEEGITEAGAMSSFIAAGTAYATHGVNTIPFFIFYSMFGFQRIGDLIWAAADVRCRGFLLGGTSGRTTLNGEGLQHEDGHSHLLACSVPNLLAYDPAFAYEIAVIVQEGIRRMYEAQEDVFYYITLGNEPYPMPAVPEGVTEGILKGLYKFKADERRPGWPRVHLFGSGAILREALRAQTILAEQFGVSADVWSATSYKELRRDALAAERWNVLHPTRRPRKPYVTRLLEKEEGPVVAASDYMKALPDLIAPWAPGGLRALGTDGFGRSDSRAALRRHFEVDAESIAVTALHALWRQGKLKKERVEEAIRTLGIDPEKPDPVTA
ncbi:MAG: pyruvate dehydrogenase (acetyl-transferring), homodimeric type [Candidatus Handelsmanbacteria bacterium RIFCSPLOWO2_12_FULL_64_10]|uniref:Pyruvate dehydrogenase E1 component n=1 Tax=Handelsmanbacteria sp. (strain RIFCSPLOWO2_12_FULL_64_10) TaxID=1817868 RepID=A0A1F6C9Z6_HANXR|nr:MAG: pyruvate dehydrogenase (acetyl-transferring), homodimeric type [Candidatus Handelsmanbacteria bacterium RIFCSPLOWO2_12_FULL_64_10]